MVRNTLLLIAFCIASTLLVGCQAGFGPQRVLVGPDCPPGPKPCPREYPDFPMPPGGPYLKTPAHGGGTWSTPERLDLSVKPGK